MVINSENFDSVSASALLRDDIVGAMTYRRMRRYNRLREITSLRRRLARCGSMISTSITSEASVVDAIAWRVIRYHIKNGGEPNVNNDYLKQFERYYQYFDPGIMGVCE